MHLTFLNPKDIFRMQGARAERYLYLFEKVLLIGKKREDGLISVKTHIPVSDFLLDQTFPRNKASHNKMSSQSIINNADLTLIF